MEEVGSSHKKLYYNRLRAYAQEKGYRVVAEYSDVASGLNQNRRGLEHMLKAAEKGGFKKLLIECPDRLARFGYTYLECYLKCCGVEIEITSQREPEDAHTELVQDLLAIVSLTMDSPGGSRRRIIPSGMTSRSLPCPYGDPV